MLMHSSFVAQVSPFLWRTDGLGSGLGSGWGSGLGSGLVSGTGSGALNGWQVDFMPRLVGAHCRDTSAARIYLRSRNILTMPLMQFLFL